jgi:hypothetical protein
MQTEGYQPKATDMQEAQRRTIATTPVALPATAPAVASAASTVRAPAAKATKPAGKPVKAAAVSTAQPAPVDANKTPRKRQAAVWGTVEAAGHQARQIDAAAASPAQKTDQKPATPPTPAAAA